MGQLVTKAVAVSCLVSLACAQASWSSEIFSDFTFEQAQEKALKNKQLLLVDFTASWCPPCKMMEKSTWTDESLKEWVKDNAILLQFDVDKSRDVASQFKIRAMPTLVLFTPEKGKEEFDRKLGYMGAEEVLAWLKAARAGKSAEEVKKATGGSGGAEIMERISKARELQAAEKHAEAMAEYLWLWENLEKQEGQMQLIRRSLVPGEMKALSKKSAEAKAKVVTARDVAKEANKMSDWLILNAVLEDDGSTLAWFDEVKKDPGKKGFLVENSGILVPVLWQKKRWADAADYLYPNPLEIIAGYHKKVETARKGTPDTKVSDKFDPLPTMVMLLYGSHVGDGKDKQAKEIEDECLRLNDTPGMRNVLKRMKESMEKARTSKGKM